MSSLQCRFVPETPLLLGRAHDHCKAVIVVPARNEEDSLATTLDALAAQQDLYGKPLDPTTFEILLLLNNCTDSSAAVAKAWKQAHPRVHLQIVKKRFRREHAHVGTARRLLMDTAWSRLQGRSGTCGILSTDSDTVVCPDWIAQNLRALAHGADAVGGKIDLKPGELQHLPEGARTAYILDQQHQRLTAELEARLDPQTGDPWPRHLEHFGASLACTPAMYERVGGLPAVSPLEDAAFVDRLWSADARLRHEPAVRVLTSSRFDGRASIGLSWQLRQWQEAHEAGEFQQAPSGPWLAHRFRSLHFLRQICRVGKAADLRTFAPSWKRRIRKALTENLNVGEFLGRVQCDEWINETYTGRVRDTEIHRALRGLRAAVVQERKHVRSSPIENTKVGNALIPKNAMAATRVAAGQSDNAQLDAR